MSWCATPQPWKFSDRSITVELGGIEFKSDHMSGEWPEWGLGEIAGLWDSGPRDVETVRTGRGHRVVSDQLAPRVVTWRGLLTVAPHEDAPLTLLAAMDEVRGLTDGVVRFLETDYGLYREGDCRVVEATVTPLTDRHATYRVTVSLDDPLLYSADEVTLPRSVQNAGDHDAFPLVTVQGPATSPVVTVGGTSIPVGQSLTASQTAVVDCANGDVWVGNSRVFPSVSAWPVIRPGQSVSIAVSSGQGRVRRVSAWK